MRGSRRIHPLEELGPSLLSVEKPARYLGGELGSIRKEGAGLLDIALCFPDLYEIGMSNNAIRILYGELNAIPGVRCERVFAPAPDFEGLLKEKGLPLYTLETGIALGDVDLLGFTIGYELAATSMLAVLDTGGVPLLARNRGESDPIVIAGGPAVSNPHPLADFLDAAYIGEAEGDFYALVAELAALKLSGAGRAELLGRMAAEQAIWMPARAASTGKRAVRAVYSGFATRAYRTGRPVATVKTVQDHGTVEIMRGCPNGCRFCHAGYYYRPQRCKPYEIIREEVEALVREGGHREITLASLSSGDYSGVGELIQSLNAEWGTRKVSFQLPSLKVNSFTLPLIAALSEVRKSGLTFAVETPVDEWQLMLNKDVSFERSLAILEEAKAQGFRQAKFYFMLGLPLPGRGDGEVDTILDFFARLLARVDIQVNVNVGTFVPKPHTPFQWSLQLGESESLAAINRLRSGLRRHRNLKLSYHSPFVSQLEGVLSRGDERVGGLILEAWKRGARLDAWEERFDRELWRAVIANAGWDVIGESCRERSPDESLPWDDISVRIPKSYFLRELDRSREAVKSAACMDECTEPCGSCSADTRIVSNTTQVPAPGAPNPDVRAHREPASRMVFRYSKNGTARYFQHLTVIDSLDRAFMMAAFPVAFSQGFNPAPRLETGQPIPIAFGSDCEIGTVLLQEELDPTSFVLALNACLPDGLRLEEARCYPVKAGVRQRSIGSLAWGSDFLVRPLLPGSLPGLFEAVSATLGQVSIPSAAIAPGLPGEILLRLPEPDSKDHGLVRILQASLGIPDELPQVRLDVRRTSFLARTVVGGEPMSFFDAYQATSG